MGVRLTRVAAFFFISSILVSPIPFGAIHNWAWALMAIAIGLAAAAFACSNDMKPFTIEWRTRLGLPFLGFATVLLWILVQAQLFLLLAPAQPVRRIAAEYAGTWPHSWNSSVGDIPDSLFRILTYGLVFILSVAFGRSRPFANVALRVFALGGLLIALYAIISWRFTPDWLLWKQRENYHGFATGTFVNRNTFATYAGLVLITITAIILTQKTQAGYVSGRSWIRWIVPHFVMQLERNWFWILAWITVLFALLLSGSRAGTLSTVTGTICLVLLVERVKADGIQNGRSLMRRLMPLTVVVSAMLAVYFAGGNILAARIWDGDIVAQADERLAIYKLALRAIADSFWTGAGLGTFPRIFEIYRTTHQSLQPGSEFVHNSFLEVTLGLGVPAALLFYSALAYCAYQCLRGVKRRNLGRVYPALGAAATILAGMHSLVDFSLEIPAVASAYAFLLGLGFSQAWPRIRREANAPARTPDIAAYEV